ncbi:DUF1206 domain-containing protein [Demequina sp. NBRC 110053]|uniref:DUF1206 domain-containing protein n=1 Tax=Demequina sp. NBRC 110053 TaxID=1570342 RepID=UPI000A070099|nr:DUF1206 domain-containing protein [Demequina sp. NBRC 110053]
MVTSNTPLKPSSAGGAWEKAARAGYAVSGALHIALGLLIAQIGLSGGGEEASSSQALSSLADNTFGAVILWIAVVAFAALALWQLADALRGHDEAKDRVKAAAKAGVYAVLAFSAASIAMGSGGGGGDSQAQGIVATALGWPGGQFIVGAVGLAILGAGVFHVIKGARKKFLEDLRGVPSGSGRVVRGLGMTGYIAKGVALGVVGVLFTYAAVTADPDNAEGLDGAVKSLLDLPGGPVIVILVGLGFAAYGLYSFVRARYGRL